MGAVKSCVVFSISQKVISHLHVCYLHGIWQQWCTRVVCHVVFGPNAGSADGFGHHLHLWGRCVQSNDGTA